MSLATREWTAADLERLPDDGNRYEVIDGELLVTPAPSLDHQEAVGRLFTLLRPYVSARALGHVVIAPADVKFSDRRSVQPDVFVLPLAGGRRPRAFGEVGRLLLAVEVLSPSTARTDRVKKRRVYREERVDEYWVVDLDARVIERSRPATDQVDVFANRFEWCPEGADAPLRVDVERFFADVMDE